MSSLRSILVTISAELRTGKIQTRNKAAEQLDKLLKETKNEIIELFRNQHSSNDLAITELFNSVIEAILAHSANVEENRGSKGSQLLRNKNFVYRGIVTNLIEYHLEDGHYFISKSCLLAAFIEGFRNRCALSCFGAVFLDILERGIFKTPDCVRELKVNEYSRILSYLFEVNVCNDDVLRFAILNTIIKTIEIALLHVPIGTDLIAYLPEILTFAHKANMEQRRADVIKLFYLFISELSVNYYHAVCSALQNQLSVIISFYQYPMKNDTKETFFQAIYIALKILYPHTSKDSCELLVVKTPETWTSVLDYLQTIIYKEVKVYKTTTLTQEKHLSEHWFIKMAACATYLKLWTFDGGIERHQSPKSGCKIKKQEDRLEHVLGFVHSGQTQQVDATWLAIFTEILCDYTKTINAGNICQVLQTSIQILQESNSTKHLHYFRRYLVVLLDVEEKLISFNHISVQNCSNLWTKLVEILKSNSTTNLDVVADQQMILRALIQHGKLTAEDCTALLESFINNAPLKRNECIETVYQILKLADSICFDKNSELVERITKWIYDTNEKNRMQHILHGIAPIDDNLLAETSAIAVINFLHDGLAYKPKYLLQEKPAQNFQLSTLVYKQNRKFICLDYKTKLSNEVEIKKEKKKTCLFQNNYNSLMRTLNFEPTKDTNMRSILIDLNSLKKIALVMKALIDFDVFDNENFYHCPLIKRIGLFLNQLEFQLKSSKHEDYNNVFEIMQHLETLFDVVMSSPILMKYLETQSLEEIISFVGNSLHLSVTRHNDCELDNWFTISRSSIRVLSILCGNPVHYIFAFGHIASYEVKFPSDVDAFFDVIEVFSEQRNIQFKTGEWIVNHLKTLFKHYHTDIYIIGKIIKLIPAIFIYICEFDSLLHIMFIAMVSLLKLAYKKSYSINVTESIIQTVECIFENCRGLHSKPEFKNICLMVVQFLAFSELKIQFTTVQAITAFIDANNLQSRGIDNYVGFCDEIFSHLDLEELSTSTADLEENAISVTVQVLVSFFVFSKYHKEAALKALVCFCALRKLKEAHLNTFQQVASYHGCSLQILCATFIRSLIHTWTSNQYPIDEFPYFLCSDNQEDFFSKNLTEIITCILLYGKPNDLKPINKYITKDVFKMITPRVTAFILPYDCDCPEARNPYYEQRVQNLKENAKFVKINISKTNKTALNWETIFYLMSHMEDNNHFKSIFGCSVTSVVVNWFSLSFKSLKGCLNYYVNETQTISEGLLDAIIIKTPLDLLRVLQEMQKSCIKCVFSWEKIKLFHIYSSLMDIVFDSMPQKSGNSKTQKSDHYLTFFARDAIFFILNFTHKGIHLDAEENGLCYLSNVLHKPQVIDGCEKLLQSYLNEICKSLVDIIEDSKSFKTEKLCIEIIRYLIVHNKDRFESAILLLDEFPERECYEELRGLSFSLHDFQNVTQEASAVLTSYIRSNSRGIGGVRTLRQYVQKHKALLQRDNNILYDLVNKLVTTVRNSNNCDLMKECALCLGDIGPLKIERSAYYFYAENSFYENEPQASDPTTFFHLSLLNLVDKMLIDFDPNIYQAVFEVAEKLSNSVCGKALIAAKVCFYIFSSSCNSQNYLDTIASCSPIDWIYILKSTENTTDYNSWICNFMTQAFKNVNWNAFQEISSKNAYFADISFLPLIKLFISEKEIHLHNILEMLEYFFEKFVKCNRKEMDWNVIFRDKRVIRKFLDICECVRTGNDRSLSLNLLNVTAACNYCQAYFMSILYLELYYLQEKDRGEKSRLQLLENQVFQTIAVKAYESIGCSDAIATFLNPLKSRMHFLTLTNSWSDILLETTSIEPTENDLYSSVLKRNGILPFIGINKKTDKIDYELCWRLCLWDVPINKFSKANTLIDMEQEFQKQHYSALKCLFNREKNNTLAALSNARRCVVSILNDISIECLQSVYRYLTWLQLLQQIDDFCEVQFYSGANLKEVFGKWKAESSLEYGNFRHKEEVISHQIALFHTAGVRANRKILEVYKVNPIEICLLNCVTSCKKAGEINLAKRNIALLRNMDITDKLVKINMLLEDAEISFYTGKPEITKSILDYIIHSEEIRSLYSVRAIILFGEYLMETNSQTFENVLKNTFSRAITFLDDLSQNKEKILGEHPEFLSPDKFDEFERGSRKDAYKAAAKYADREYIQFNAYIKSDEFRIKRKIIEENREAAESVSRQDKDRDRTVGATLLKKNANLDEREMKTFEIKCIQNLCIAIEYYIKFCKIDETASESTIYRIIALWFSNKDDNTFYSKIGDTLLSIPSYKFICALNQITGRLNSTGESFLALLKNLLIICVKEHPHQTLYKLFPLVFAFYDEKGNKTNNRVEIAREIISKSKTKGNTNCIKQLETVFPALIKFANVDVPLGSKIKSMSLSENLQKLRNLDAVQCPTIDLPSSPNLKYNITTIFKWNSTVTLVGGINAPKKLICLCSDGVNRPQLLKGKDDLRQDAVMQQVFAIINNLLTNEPETLKRRLAIRTYSVVPLSIRSGILEWCENTTPLGLYLVAAHAKYRPSDYSVAKCRNLSLQHLKSDHQKRLDVFNNICQKIHPVMQFFLLEKFPVPGIWFERRLAYINSVATNSIVGFILGIGDRHTQNILIDEKSAELIHIDFGIAFEQGKIMPTPETVPFRLTRDIVAPMGICKTGGIFNIACEATMEILRRHRVIVMTILEVLLYDPLYMWKVLQETANKFAESGDGTNLTAQRTLLCVQNKLEGKQAGSLGTSDISVQVQRLVNEAISPYNLCQLYPGWDPYL